MLSLCYFVLIIQRNRDNKKNVLPVQVESVLEKMVEIGFIK